MKNILITAILSFLLTIPMANGQSVPVDPQFRTGELSNGLRYYIRHNEIPKGRADFYLLQKVGSLQEEENERGLAHFLEHMAFNGTMDFPEGSLINELEKKGIKFGRNINAHTTYGETVYKLSDIPVLREGVVDTSLQILQNWSAFISNHDKDIEEERGVIREEWRTRSSGYLRVLETGILPVIFENTPYADRLPIGKMEVINNFKPQELRDFYKKWYRPDLQGIIIVGDIDVESIEKKIKSLFADIPKPNSPTPKTNSSIPPIKEPIVAIVSDPEIPGVQILINWKIKNRGNAWKNSSEYYQQQMINSIISNMFNQRLADISKEEDRPFNSAVGTLTDFFVSRDKAWKISGSPANNEIKKTLKALLLEAERMKKFGFSLKEMKPIVNFNHRMNERELLEKDIKPNIEYVNQCIDHFFENNPIPSTDWKYETNKKILSQLSLDTLNYWAREYIDPNSIVVTILGPENQKENYPKKDEIIALLKEVKNTTLEPYIHPVKIDELANLESKGGHIVKTEPKAFGYIQWTLSNGVKVQFKDTNYKEDKVFLYGFRPGGYSTVNIENLPSALAINDLLKLEIIETGNEGGTGAHINRYVRNYYEEVSGSGSVKNIAALFKLTYLKITNLKENKDQFNNYIESSKKRIRNRSAEPKAAFSDTLRSIMKNNHPRAISLEDSTILDKVKYDKVIGIFKERFADASDFTFFLTGNMEADSIKPLVEKWLGGLPSLNRTNEMLDSGIQPPKGLIQNHFSKEMIVPQSTVTIAYTGEIPLTIENQTLMSCLTGILHTIYIEEMREKEGGTYGAGVSGNIEKFPKERFIFQINFDTNTEKRDRLIEIAYKEIGNIMKNGPSYNSLETVKSNLIKNHKEQTGEKNAMYWARTATNNFVYGINWENYEKIISSITPEMVKEFAENIFTQGNRIEVVMDPKKNN